LISAEELRLRALELALELNHPIYDCFYLALAERERCPLVSADKKLLGAAKKMKGVEARKL
jgi:predicted nucleic acid-binding protein